MYGTGAGCTSLFLVRADAVDFWALLPLLEDEDVAEGEPRV